MRIRYVSSLVTACLYAALKFIPSFGWASFAPALGAGYLLKETPAKESLNSVLKTANKWLLYGLIPLVIATSNFSSAFESSILLFFGGVGIQLFPTLVGFGLMKLGRDEQAANFFSFATFGGGNRGVWLLVTLAASDLLGGFVIADLGNFLSLLLFYPLLQGHAYGRVWLKDAIVILGLIGLGLLLHRFILSLEEMMIVALTGLKFVLNFTVAAQLGLGLDWQSVKHKVWRILLRMFVVRSIVFTPALALYWYGFELVALPLLVFVILPTSSIAPSLCSEQYREVIEEDAAVTSIIFVGAAVIFMTFSKIL